MIIVRLDLQETTLVFRVKKTGKSPCASELHVIFQKIPVEWLEKALLRLDELSVEEFSKFGEKLDVFAIDGSALTGEILVEREVLTRIRLIRDYFEYQAIIRTTTNTIIGVKNHSNKISNILYLLPQNSTVTADPEFDVEENYQKAEEAHIDFHVKQRKGDIRKSRRKAARRRFDKKKYGKRKLGERPFGNIEVRRTKCYYKKPEKPSWRVNSRLGQNIYNYRYIIKQRHSCSFPFFTIYEINIITYYIVK